MKLQTYYEFPSEIASEQIKSIAEAQPSIKEKFFTVFVSERNGNNIYKIRSVNFNGLKETAKWCKDETSRDQFWFNNFDQVSAPSKSNNTERVDHYKRGLTSYIPVGSLVDLMVEIHDSKVDSNQTKDAFSRYEANLVRRPPNTTPELNKLSQGKDIDIDRVIEEATQLKRYKNMHFLQTL
jgi:hypothetical protein